VPPEAEPKRPLKRACLADAIAAKLEDGNIRAAVRLLMSDDKPADDSVDTLVKLHEKHPTAPSDRQFPVATTEANLCVDENDVIRAARSFPAGSSGGPDGFRPQHLVDLINNREAGQTLQGALTAFVNTVLQGSCPAEIIPVMFGGRLIALSKPSGGIRPIAVGYTLRRLISKCANTAIHRESSPHISPRDSWEYVRQEDVKRRYMQQGAS
jgi:hypothetical protein